MSPNCSDRLPLNCREVLHNWKPCSFETIFQEFYRERKALGPSSVSAATQEQQQQLHALQERQSMHEKWIIDPNSQFKTVWDAILSLMTVLSCVIVPFQTCFNLGYNALDILFNVLYSLDILVSLRTAFLDENATHLVMDPTVIAKRYLRQWFTIDFLSSGIVDVLVLLLDQVCHTLLLSQSSTCQLCSPAGTVSYSLVSTFLLISQPISVEVTWSLAFSNPHISLFCNRSSAFQAICSLRSAWCPTVTVVPSQLMFYCVSHLCS